MSLEQQLKQLFPWLTDRDFGHQHRIDHPDLYVVSYPEVDHWLQENYQWYDNIDKFTGNDQAAWNGAGKTCLSIPFADYSW
jgi:hypothetical protein